MKNTLHFFQVFALAFFLVFSLSSAAPIGPKNDDRHNAKEHRKEQRKAKRQKKLKKLLSSKTVKFVIKQIQKREERLQRKLQKAEKDGKTKKAERIKKRLNGGKNLIIWGLCLMIAGSIISIVALVLVIQSGIAGDEGAALFWVIIFALTSIISLVGLILLIVGVKKE